MLCVSAFVVLVRIVIDAFGYIRGLKAIDLCLQQHNQMRISQGMICVSHKNVKDQGQIFVVLKQHSVFTVDLGISKLICP